MAPRPSELVRCAGWALPGALVWTVISLVLGQAGSVGAHPAAVVVVGLGASWLSLTLLIWAARSLRAPGAPAWQRLAQRTLLAACGVSTLPVLGLALVIHRTTHHRPLGAVVLALGALGLFLAACLLVSRVVLEAHRGNAFHGALLRVSLWLGGLSGAALAGLMAVVAVRSLGYGWVADAAAGLGAGALGLALGAAFTPQPVALLRISSLCGLAAAVASVGWLGSDPSLASEMARAPLLTGLPGLLLR